MRGVFQLAAHLTASSLAVGEARGGALVALMGSREGALALWDLRETPEPANEVLWRGEGGKEGPGGKGKAPAEVRAFRLPTYTSQVARGGSSGGHRAPVVDVRVTGGGGGGGHLHGASLDEEGVLLLWSILQVRDDDDACQAIQGRLKLLLSSSDGGAGHGPGGAVSSMAVCGGVGAGALLLVARRDASLSLYTSDNGAALVSWDFKDFKEGGAPLSRVAWSASHPAVFAALDTSGTIHWFHLNRDFEKPILSLPLALPPPSDASGSAGASSEIAGVTSLDMASPAHGSIKNARTLLVLGFSSGRIEMHVVANRFTDPEAGDAQKLAEKLAPLA
ncbi:hypothetical protein T484DRAFT_1949180 [Baffinella frigidus]|nr:hypothetical protein T484DRAFT_1949180 [Cryptophyta sp. CCMP2293]